MAKLTNKLSMMGGICVECDTLAVVQQDERRLECPRCGNAEALDQLFAYMKEECDLAIADFGDGKHLLHAPRIGFSLTFSFNPKIDK